MTGKTPRVSRADQPCVASYICPATENLAQVRVLIMATVWIPSLLRELCGGNRIVDVPGRSVRQVIDSLEQRCPGIKERLVEDGQLRPDLAVSVDGETTQIGLLQPVGEDSEIHILPALGGGATR
jgi:molybdopterin synthase sulfur carrier subunit